jgi:hypothetical protein
LYQCFESNSVYSTMLILDNKAIPYNQTIFGF